MEAWYRYVQFVCLTLDKCLEVEVYRLREQCSQPQKRQGHLALPYSYDAVINKLLRQGFTF
jgi:hypothetical protein